MHLHLEVDYRQAVPIFEAQVMAPLVSPLVEVRTHEYLRPPHEADHSLALRIRIGAKTMDAPF